MLKKGPPFMHKNIMITMILVISGAAFQSSAQTLTLNDQEYFARPGLDVMVFQDFYPEGHQGGVTVIQNGDRTAANGDLRLGPVPGQWQPVPKLVERTVDRDHNSIQVRLVYPDSSRNKKGFNPVVYPDLHFYYTIHVTTLDDAVLITVDLEKPLSKEWTKKVGFNLELFPGCLFGHAYMMDGSPGFFPRNLTGPVFRQAGQKGDILPLAAGKHLVVAPENRHKRMEIMTKGEPLQLYDGRAFHNNGWFVVRSTLTPGVTKNAIQWIIKAGNRPDWLYTPVVHVSQVGYLPQQPKTAVIETDPNDENRPQAQLLRILPGGEKVTILSQTPEAWGRFLRYQYYQFDFSRISDTGIYEIAYGQNRSNPFMISPQVYSRHVWQPTLETFLPVQMCHMRVNDRYRVWHGRCHMDDALMAPTDLNHFDGYRQGPSTLTEYQALEPVPGLNVGGWHDAGDYDLRVESQAGTVYTLALAYEEFGVEYDETTIDRQNHLVELHQPDGRPDILQQIEHGVLTILAGYKNLGRLYRGIICPDLRQYVMLGDGVNMTDNNVWEPNQTPAAPRDDRLVFTEENPSRELDVAAALAAAARVLTGYDDSLSLQCLDVAENLWNTNSDKNHRNKITAAAELLLATHKPVYKSALLALLPDIKNRFSAEGWCLGRTLPLVDNSKFTDGCRMAAKEYAGKTAERQKQNPFGVPYRPHIWGAGWSIQRFGVSMYFLHAAWPDLFAKDGMLSALNFILGCHPGHNTASFASGVGVHSLTVAYGFNRADWSYIPGGVASGTALIRPDLPELKDWPFFWQQTEYVVGGGASHFMFLVLAAEKTARQ